MSNGAGVVGMRSTGTGLVEAVAITLNAALILAFVGLAWRPSFSLSTAFGICVSA